MQNEFILKLFYAISGVKSASLGSLRSLSSIGRWGILASLRFKSLTRGPPHATFIYDSNIRLPTETRDQDESGRKATQAHLLMCNWKPKSETGVEPVSLVNAHDGSGCKNEVELVSHRYLGE